MKHCAIRLCTLLTAVLLAIPSPDALGLRAAARRLSASAADADRILSITVSTGEEDGSIPLASIILDIYKTAESGTPAGKPTEEELAGYKVRSNLVATVMTDETGSAEFNFTQAHQPDGVYLIAEQYNPATAGEVEPFYITVDGGDLELHLEKMAEKAPGIQMDITSLQQKSDSFSIGEPHTWTIRSDIPAGIVNARQYCITDVIDYRLTYEKGSPTVTLHTGGGSDIDLKAEQHYILTENAVTNRDHTLDRFCISLTPDGMSYVAANTDSGDRKAELRISFRAAINQNTAMGATIPNDAHLDYINSAGLAYSADSDIPEVHTGGINLLRTDSEEQPVSGASFMIAREATQAEMEDETILKEVMHVGNKNLAVVYVDFYTAEMTGGKRFTVTTGPDGRASIYGLSYGSYYLVEITEAPENQLPSAPIPVEIQETSHLTAQDGWQDAADGVVDNTVHISGKTFLLPDSGGMGTTAFTFAGILLICAACILLLSNRNRKV